MTQGDAPRSAAPAGETPGAVPRRRGQRRGRHKPVRRRGPGWYVGRIAVLLLGAPFVFAFVAAVSLFGRDVTAPTWIKTKVETQAAVLLDGGELSFGSITVTLGADLHPRVRLSNTVLRDADGAILARVPRIEAVVSPRGLVLRRELLVQEIDLTGMQIALRRTRDGRVAVAFDAAAVTMGEAEGFAGLLAQLDLALARPALEALEQVTATGLIVNYEDARAARSWTVDDGAISLDLRGGQTRLTGTMSVLSGRSYVSALAVSYNRPRASQTAELAATVTDAAAADLASQSPALNWLGVVDAPLSASLRTSLGVDGVLGPVNASLEIGAGVVQPTAQTRPLRFSGAKAYLAYLPATSEIRFDRIEAASEWGTAVAAGTALLRDVTDGLPATLLGQFRLTEISLNPGGLYPGPIVVDEVVADLRLRLAPFSLEAGQFRISQAGQPVTGTARVETTPQGWQVAVDAHAPVLTLERLLAVWPAVFRPGMRQWFATNLTTGRVTDVTVALRSAPQVAPVIGATFGIDGATVRFLPKMPPLERVAGFATFADNAFVLEVATGQVTAPQGGRIDAAGSVLTVPDVRVPDAPARIDLRLDGAVTAMLSMLDQPPLGLITRAGIAVDGFDGQATAQGRVELPFTNGVPPEAIRFSASAEVSDVRSTVIVPGRTVTANRVTVAADNALLSVAGDVAVGAVPMTIRFERPIGVAATGAAVLTGTVDLSQRFLDEFRIALPEGTVRGRGRADLRLDLPKDAAPQFTLSSRLRGVGLQVPAVGWSKAPEAEAALEVAGVLGRTPRIDRLTLEAPGLRAQGAVTLTPAGELDRARFSRVRVGDWFDAPVEVRGRGPGAPVAVTVDGGTLDFRRSRFGNGGGEGGPMTIALDRVQISEGIALTRFRGEFSGERGFSGRFAAQLNDGAAVQGTVIPQAGRSAVRITGNDAGAAFSSIGFLKNAAGGDLDLTLLPAGTVGHYDGTLAVTGLRVRDAPALAALLDAVSVVGLLQQMDGQGLSFTNVDAQFRLTPDEVIVTQSSAVGPGLGISLDGRYGLRAGVLDFQGVISPFYLVNGIGAFLTRRGEGFIGFNYTLRGPVADMRVAVNPLSALTPGMFREIFRRPPPTVSQ